MTNILAHIADSIATFSGRMRNTGLVLCALFPSIIQAQPRNISTVDELQPILSQIFDDHSKANTVRHTDYTTGESYLFRFASGKRLVLFHNRLNSCYLFSLVTPDGEIYYLANREVFDAIITTCTPSKIRQ